MGDIGEFDPPRKGILSRLKIVVIFEKFVQETLAPTNEPSTKKNKIRFAIPCLKIRWFSQEQFFHNKFRERLTIMAIDVKTCFLKKDG
jgi:hypothetical protein